MKAAVLKPLEVVPESLWIWIQVFESGAVRFLRQVKSRDLEDVGTLPSTFFPSWIEEYFACVYVYADPLKAEATISVEHAGSVFPAWFADPPTTDVEAVWSLLDPAML